MWSITWTRALWVLLVPKVVLTDSELLRLVHQFDSPVDDLLVLATVDIILHNYARITKQLYVRSEDTADLTGTILRRTTPHQTLLLESHPKQLSLLEETTGQYRWPLRAHNLFTVDDYAGFQRIMDSLNDELYDFSGFYTVLVADPTEQGLDTAGAILNALWTLYIVNVVVLLGPTDSVKGARLYTYFPYGNGYCERPLPVVWNVYEPGVGFVHHNRTPFPSKLHNFFGCPLTVATFSIYPFIIPVSQHRLAGIEGLMLGALQQQFNFRLHIVIVDPPDWGTAGPRKDATGASAYIRQRRANLTIGYWATTLHRNQYMSSSFVYYTSSLVLAVPPGHRYSSLELLRFPFTVPIWLILLLTLSIGLTIIELLQRCAQSSIQRLVLGQAPRNAWPAMISVLLGGGLTHAPIRNFARTLLMHWLLCTLVLRSAYTGSMFRFLREGGNHSVPETIPALLDAGYNIYMYRNYSFVFDNFPQVLPHIRIVSVHQFRLEIIAKLQRPSARLGLLLPLETVTFLNRNITKQGQLLRIGRERVFLAKLAIYGQRSSPLIDPLNKVLQIFASSGLISRWASQYHQLQFITDIYKSRGHQQFVFRDMFGSLVLLLFGLGLSSVAFGAELVMRIRKKQTAFPIRLGKIGKLDSDPFLNWKRKKINAIAANIRRKEPQVRGINVGECTYGTANGRQTHPWVHHQ